jgi:hypothetical protein
MPKARSDRSAPFAVCPMRESSQGACCSVAPAWERDGHGPRGRRDRQSLGAARGVTARRDSGRAVERRPTIASPIWAVDRRRAPAGPIRVAGAGALGQALLHRALQPVRGLALPRSCSAAPWRRTGCRRWGWPAPSRDVGGRSRARARRGRGGGRSRVGGAERGGGQHPSEPVSIAATSDSMSPNRLSVTITSNCLGARTSCMPPRVGEHVRELPRRRSGPCACR